MSITPIHPHNENAMPYPPTNNNNRTSLTDQGLDPDDIATPILLLRITSLEKSIASLEETVNAMVRQMERANGAWTFIKIMASLVIGITILWAFLSQHFSIK